MTAIEIIRANPGLTAQELAAKFGKSEWAYKWAASKNGISLRRPKPDKEREAPRKRMDELRERNQTIASLYGTMPTIDIARRLGVPAYIVYQVVSRHRLTMTEEQAAQIRKMADERRTAAKIRKNNIARCMQLSGKASPNKAVNAFYNTKRAGARKVLVSRYGYIYLEGDTINLGYDSNTNRCTEEHHSGYASRKPEEYYTKKYGIKFYNLNDDE